MNPDRVRKSFVSQLRAITQDLRELDCENVPASLELRDMLAKRLEKVTIEMDFFMVHLLSEQAE